MAVFTATHIFRVQRRTLEIVVQAVEKVDFVVVDCATFLLVQDHCLQLTERLARGREGPSGTYKGEAEEVFWTAVGEGARAADDLALQLSLENLRHEGDLLIGEGDAAQVSERGLRQVVEQAEQEFLGWHLRSN